LNRPDDNGFWGRWSRRKAQVRGREASDQVETGSDAFAQEPAKDKPAVRGGQGATGELPPQQGPGEKPELAALPSQCPAPRLTLDDVRSLTNDSDFTPFMARSVASDVRNAAMKRLFADPHFNVMDGLDIYIDDYTQPDPLPAATLRRMASARFMKLVDEDPDRTRTDARTEGMLEEVQQTGEHGQVHANLGDPGHSESDRVEVLSSTTPADNMAPSAVCKDLPTLGPPADGVADHADADLRLQPDDAAGRASPWPKPE